MPGVSSLTASADTSTIGSAPASLAESDSILAPILVAYRRPVTGASLSEIVMTAALSVPCATIQRKQLVGRKAVPVDHTREILRATNANEQGYPLVARCCDRAPGESTSDAFPRWNWEVGFIEPEVTSYPSLIPAGHAIVRLDVTRHQVRNRGVIGAPQLALFRHMFVESLGGLDPSALILGGQRNWRREWWPNPAGQSA